MIFSPVLTIPPLTSDMFIVFLCTAYSLVVAARRCISLLSDFESLENYFQDF